MNKAVKVILIISAAILSLFLAAFGAYFIITAGSNLQPQKLIDHGKTVTVFDQDDNIVENASYLTKRKSVKTENLKDYTVNAFIASEDRNFFRHNGLNYKRMIKAAYKNAVSRSFKEGASTISQQLIKNTHLNNDKTITRKLKEIKLTRQLERRYTKDEILEMYLNTIYFGHNCYGLQNAAYFYYGVPAEELTLEQSATMVGLLTSPNNYSPFKNPEKCINRRNTVLKNMLDCGYIDHKTYSETVGLPLSARRNEDNGTYSGYLREVFDELEECNINPYGDFSELKIKTNLNADLQNIVDRIDAQSDCSIVIRNNLGGICAYKSSIGNVKRQIGSCAKPIFVYAPAIEENKVHLFTKIDDEPINFNGYTPENYDKKYHGKVTVKDSIKYSYNVPAVKTLNVLTVEKAANYAQKMGVTLAKEDKNLSLALGGMNQGMTLKELCDCYSTFSTAGNYSNSGLIREICDQNGKVLFKRDNTPVKIFSTGTCSLINNALMETAESGTAKRLSSLGFDVACKTGTCGNRDGNTDAYAVAYTQELCAGVWLGDRDNKRTEITGGKDCCNIVKEIFSKYYQGRTCPKLDCKSDLENIEIDREEYEINDKIVLCDENCPKLNRLSVNCLKNNVPQEKSSKFTQPTIKTPTITVNNNNIAIELCQTKYYSYLINRGNQVIYEGLWKEKILDSPPDGEYEYTITPYYKSGNKIYKGKPVTLPRVIIRKEKTEQKLPDIAFKDWYNQ